jgi:hypothetical protein
MSRSDPVNNELERLVDRADLDELVRFIDALCANRDWESLFRLRSLTRSAITTGRQVWPATTLAEYRLALLAPAEWASQVLREDASRFSIGPLTEVIAQNHHWSELVPYLEPGPQRDFVAYERAMRGDVVNEDESSGDRTVLDIPLVIQSWEPDYLLPTYSDGGVDHPCPADRWNHTWTSLKIDLNVEVAEVIDDEDTDDALHRLVEPWVTHSTGQAQSIVVEGNEIDAFGALGFENVEIAPLTSQQVVHWLTWCGASGGVHGRRRGMASGRFSAWWLLAALGGFLDDWDELHAAEELASTLNEATNSMNWSRWRTAHRHAYELSLIGRDRSQGLTIVLRAHDDALTATR